MILDWAQQDVLGRGGTKRQETGQDGTDPTGVDGMGRDKTGLDGTRR